MQYEHLIKQYRILDIEGWMESDELDWLVGQGMHAKKAIEIGTFMGRSACAIMAGQLECGGYLHCIDTFDGAGTTRHDEIAQKEQWWLLDAFVDEIAERGLGNCSSVIGNSHDEMIASKFMDHTFDMVFIDACHEYESVRLDLEIWVPKLRVGGLICGHDYHESWPGVVQAVDERFPSGVENPTLGIWCKRV